MVAFLEPYPGIAPTTGHLTSVVRQMQAERWGAILSAAYFHPRHAQRVAERTGARIVPMAHQVGAAEGADDYIAMINYNVRQLLGAFGQ